MTTEELANDIITRLEAQEQITTTDFMRLHPLVDKMLTSNHPLWPRLKAAMDNYTGPPKNVATFPHYRVN